MAKRRMFSMDVIDTDKFLEMPMSSQLLYFHLAMRADDDGFISSPKRILRLIGSSEDDLRVLLSKQYVIPFDSGVCVIKHWKIHNYIQSDRYHKTIYTEEKNQLIEDDNKVYNLDTECIHDVDRMDTEVRLGKSSLGKERKGNNSASTEPPLKKKQSSKKKNELTKTDTELYNRIQKAFLSKNGEKFTNYGKEGKAIHGLIEKATRRHPENPGGFIYEMIKKFWELKNNSRENFWTSQPFLPSALNSSGIFDRVLETFRENEQQELTEEQIEELARSIER